MCRVFTGFMKAHYPELMSTHLVNTLIHSYCRKRINTNAAAATNEWMQKRYANIGI